MSDRWWRAYDRARNDPKLLKLSDRDFRGWFNLVCTASHYGGELPALPDLAIELRKSEEVTAKLVAVLLAADLLEDNDGRLTPRKWNKLQYKSDVSTERVKRFREHRRNVSETPSESEDREQIADTEKRREERAVALADCRTSDQAFALFNDAAKRTGWPEAQKIDEDRKKLMRARLKDVGGIDGFAIALGKAEASEFLTVTWPNFNLDWMLKPKNFRKLMEGNYDNRTRENPEARSLSAGLAGIYEAGSR